MTFGLVSAYHLYWQYAALSLTDVVRVFASTLLSSCLSRRLILGSARESRLMKWDRGGVNGELIVVSSPGVQPYCLNETRV
jgi:hypothetical protein